MKNQALTDLLKANPKTLQFLHQSAGMDFQKPYIILDDCGKFTFNSIEKSLKEAAPDFSLTQYRAAVLMYRNNKQVFGKLQYVPLVKFKFSPVDSAKGGYKFNIDDFYGVGDFEESRKGNTLQYFVIAQNNEHITKPKADGNIDLFQRFKREETERIIKGSDGHGKTWVSQIPLTVCDGSNKEFTYKPFDDYYPRHDTTDDLNRIIDNSGYITIERRRQLQGKANALRADRNKAAAASAQFTDRESAILEIIGKEKVILSSMLATETDGEKVRNIGRLVDNLSRAMVYFNQHLARTKNHEYRSVSQIENVLDDLDERLTKILSEVEA